jgi:hypothetical protein
MVLFLLLVGLDEKFLFNQAHQVTLKSKNSTIATLYTWPSDDGLQMGL